MIVDVQERLVPTIAEKTKIVQNIEALINAAKVLCIPALVTEQEKLGETLPELNTMLSSPSRFQKLAFSCCEIPDFTAKLLELGRKTVIACGVETHICVLQTVLGLLERGYRVLLPRDATSSYAVVDRETAIERMRDAGATITTTETIIYELTERAGTEEFRKILGIVKERRESQSR
jgi:hypothetical protein